eukprot:GHVT01100595.1.p1 GENE.GHVT01100595.1~~GHVT01100595.1.p1  ORF type:complete len:206 (-),score=53.96 GHVT01100595.1:930-1547(-)
MRLQDDKQKDQTLRTGVVVSLLLITVKTEPADILVTTLDSIQPGIWSGFFKNVLLPAASAVTSAMQKKVVVLGLARMLAVGKLQEAPEILVGTAETLAKVLFNLPDESTQRTEVQARPEPLEEEVDASNGQFDVSFTMLGATAVDTKDLLPEVSDIHLGVRQCLKSSATSLQQLAAAGQCSAAQQLLSFLHGQAVERMPSGSPAS